MISMDLETYRAALQRARADLEDCTRQKQELESKIVRLRQAIDGLSALCETAGITAGISVYVPPGALDHPGMLWPTTIHLPNLPDHLAATPAATLADVGLAVSCQDALKVGARFMTPVEVKEQLEVMGVDLSRHNNVLASIHGVLKRFSESGRALKSEADGKTSYQWNPGFVGRARLYRRGRRRR